MSLQTDQYLGFTYRGKTLGMNSSADFTGFIENSGNDLQFFNAPSFSNEFVVPQFGERTIYTGNTKSNRNIELSIQLDKITLDKYKEFLEWMNLDDQGLLSFSYNPNYGFEVKVDSISNSEFHVTREDNCDDKYYVNLSITFTTISDFASIWKNTYENKVFFPLPNPNPLGISLIDNNKNLPFVTGSFAELTVHNRHNLKNYFTIDFDHVLWVRDKAKLTKYYAYFYNAGEGAKYFSEYGIVLKQDGTFVPTGPLPTNVTSSSSVPIPESFPENRVFVFNSELTTPSFPVVRIRATHSANVWVEGKVTQSSSTQVTIAIDTASGTVGQTFSSWSLEIVDDIPGDNNIVAINPNSNIDLVVTAPGLTAKINSITPTSREIL